jgi:hypothetical protein
MRNAKLGLLAGIACVVMAVSGTADARPRPAGHHHSNFEANKTFGLGLILGEPSGLAGKYFVGPSTAIDFAIGYVGCCAHDHADGVELHADFLWHPVSLVSAPAFELPFYVGVGGRFWDFHYRGDPYHDQALGVRVPFGLAFDFNNVPLDVFLEIAPIFDLFFDTDYCGGCGDVGFDVEGAFGFRYYFN